MIQYRNSETTAVVSSKKHKESNISVPAETAADNTIPEEQSEFSPKNLQCSNPLPTCLHVDIQPNTESFFFLLLKNLHSIEHIQNSIKWCSQADVIYEGNSRVQ